MGPLDAPEVLIALLLAASLVWAVYNWTHPNAGAPK
jgi:hypothetical protein